MRGALVFAVAVAVLLPAATAPAASYDPVASGTTVLTLSSSFSGFLSQHHVSVDARGGAKRKGRTITLPAAGGEVDPAAGLASVESTGTLVFSAGSRRVPLRALVFKSKRSPLYAKVGGGQLKVASAGSLQAVRKGFGAAFTARQLRLTAKVATRLAKKLRLGKALRAGEEIGTLAVAVQPQTIHLLPGERVHLAIDPAFFAKLNELFVSLNPIAPAELAPGPVLSFPVGLESVLAPDGSLGTIKAGGAVEFLQLGSAQIFWREPWLEPGSTAISAEPDLEPSPPQAGKQPRGPLLSLPPGASVVADPSRRTIAVSGQEVTLTAGTAEALDAAFADGAPTFAAGERLGTLSASFTGE